MRSVSLAHVGLQQARYGAHRIRKSRFLNRRVLPQAEILGRAVRITEHTDRIFELLAHAAKSLPSTHVSVVDPPEYGLYEACESVMTWVVAAARAAQAAAQ